MWKFTVKLAAYYTLALIIGLFTCYGMTMATYDLLEALDMLKIGYTEAFEIGLAVAEACLCMLVANAIRKKFVPLDLGEDDEENEDVFDTKGL